MSSNEERLDVRYFRSNRMDCDEILRGHIRHGIF